MKILFVVLGVFGVMAMVFIGLFWYAAHKVKQIASNNGIDLNGITETHQGPVRRFDACELLTKDELSQILKLNIERVESTGKSSTSTCSYYSSEAQQRGLDEAAAAKKRIEDAAKAGNGKTDPAETMKDFGNIVRGITAAGGPAVGQTNGQVLSVAIDAQNAKAAMAGFKLGSGLLGAALNAQANQDHSTPADPKLSREAVTGVGDEAIAGGPFLNLFIFRKGDVTVTLDARLLPGGRDAQIAIAKLIVSKL